MSNAISLNIIEQVKLLFVNGEREAIVWSNRTTDEQFNLDFT